MDSSSVWLWGLILIGSVGLVGLTVRSRVGMRIRRWGALRRRTLFEDVLKHLLACKHGGMAARPASLAGALGLSPRRVLGLIAGMESAGLLRSVSGELRLTAEGERWALRVVRAHRLWERYLSDEAGLPMAQLHGVAERVEHRMTIDEVNALDARLGHPRSDPHGDPIPTADGDVEPLQAVSLTDWPIDQPAKILHVEDEPDVIFKQILAEGLRPGKIVHILESTPERLIVSDGQDEHCLAPIVAANIQVAPASNGRKPLEGLIRLTELPHGKDAEVVLLDADCRGLSRRRLLDLGMTTGGRIRPELRTMFREPRAFRVRDTLIALRRDQSDHVWVRLCSPSDEQEPEKVVAGTSRR